MSSTKELQALHKIWKKASKPLSWWKHETGYVGVNIRKLCKIPIPHPESVLQIGCVYLLHMDYVIQRTTRASTRKHATSYRHEILEFLKKCACKYDMPNTGSPFPWSSDTQPTAPKKGGGFVYKNVFICTRTKITPNHLSNIG